MKLTDNKEFNPHATLDMYAKLVKDKTIDGVVAGISSPLIIPFGDTVKVRTGKFVEADSNETIYVVSTQELRELGVTLGIDILLPGMRREIDFVLTNTSLGQVTIGKEIPIAEIRSIVAGSKKTKEKEPDKAPGKETK